MRDLILDKQVYEKCNDSIVISGNARGGTTIVGKIIHSFQDVEYFFEPPMLFSLLPLIFKLDKKYWKLLYETYLYEDLLMNALAGRGLNCNLIDDSSIYKVKSDKFITDRLNKSLRKSDAEHMALNSYIAYKMPSMIPFFQQLKEYYPGTKVILILRQAEYVFNSLIEKGWFSDKTLKGENVIWPNRFLNGLRIPFWVASGDEQKWYKMDELHRIAYYYIRINESIGSILEYNNIVKYEELIKNPQSTAKRLAENLNLSFGEKTEEILNSVKPTEKKRDYNILKNLEPKVREQVEYYSNIS